MADDDDDDCNILNIQISDADDDDPAAKKAHRTGQTEAAFQAVKRDYHVKVENGQIYEAVKLPLPPHADKQLLQQLLHAVEELCFFRRHRDALCLIESLLSHGSARALDHDTCALLLVYRQRCQQKLNASS